MEESPSPWTNPGPSRIWAGLAILLLLNIYLLAWLGRGMVYFLERHGALKPMAAMAALGGVGVLVLAAKKMAAAGPGRAFLAVLVFAVSEALSLSITRTIPESIHTIEYELLAFFIFHALKEGRDGRRLYMTTLGLVFIAGWSDEAMQFFVPERYYDPLDVLLNFVSGCFGLIIAVILNGGLERKNR